MDQETVKLRLRDEKCNIKIIKLFKHNEANINIKTWRFGILVTPLYSQGKVSILINAKIWFL